MFGNNNQISPKQLGRQTVLTFLGIFMILAPAVVTMRGRSGIISCLLGTALTICFLFYLSCVMESFGEPKKSLGKIFGRLVILLYVVFLTFSGGFLVRLLHGIVGKYLITNVHPWLISGLIIVVSAWGTGWNTQRRARMAEVAYPIVLGGFVLMMILAAAKMPVDNLHMDMNVSLSGIIRGSYQYFALFCAVAVAPFLVNQVKYGGGAGKRLMRSVNIVAIFTLLCLLILDASFGSKGLTYRQIPILDLMSGVKLPGAFLQRFDIMWMFLLLFTLLFAAGSTFFYANYLLERVDMQGSYGHVVLAFIALIIACIEFRGQTILDVYGPALQYAGVPALLFLSLCIPLVGKKGTANVQEVESS
jgi:hypothetical protein